MTSTLVEVVEAMAAALAPIGATIDGLQVLPYMNANPTPPSIDIYPGTPFQGSREGGDEGDLYFTVRARTTFADHVAGQQGLYRLLDPAGPESVQHALEADQTLGGVVQSLGVTPEGVSGFTEYLEDATAAVPARRRRMESESADMKTTYKVTGLVPFDGHQPGDEFEAELDDDLEDRAVERGSISIVKGTAKKKAEVSDA